MQINHNKDKDYKNYFQNKLILLFVKNKVIALATLRVDCSPLAP